MCKQFLGCRSQRWTWMELRSLIKLRTEETVKRVQWGQDSQNLSGQVMETRELPRERAPEIYSLYLILRWINMNWNSMGPENKILENSRSPTTWSLHWDWNSSHSYHPEWSDIKLTGQFKTSEGYHLRCTSKLNLTKGCSITTLTNVKFTISIMQ